MACSNGSRPKDGRTGYVWMDVTQASSLCLGDSPPWYCYLVGGLINWAEDVTTLCSVPPPPPDDYTFVKENFGIAEAATAISKFTAYIRSINWYRYCECIPGDPPPSPTNYCGCVGTWRIQYFETNAGPFYTTARDGELNTLTQVTFYEPSINGDAIGVGFSCSGNIRGLDRANSGVRFSGATFTKDDPACVSTEAPPETPGPPPLPPTLPPDVPFPPPAIPGPRGPKGDKGDPGRDGLDGLDGEDGEDGIDGINGINGLNGLPGVDGAKGDTGLPGEQGIQGERGIRGDDGVDGSPGIQGEQGIKGEQGIQGFPGLAGSQGVKGDTGEQGIPGEKGEDAEVEFEPISLPVAVCDANGLVQIANQVLPVLVGRLGGQGALYASLFNMVAHVMEEMCGERIRREEEEAEENKETISETITGITGRNQWKRDKLVRVIIVITSFPIGLGRRYGYNTADKFYFGGFAFIFTGIEPEHSIDWEMTEGIPVEPATGVEVSLEPFTTANITLIREV